MSVREASATVGPSCEPRRGRRGEGSGEMIDQCAPTAMETTVREASATVGRGGAPTAI